MILSMRCRLAELRKSAGYTQAQFADIIGLSRNEISNIECGKYFPSAVLIALFLDCFECDFYDLFEVIWKPL